MSLAAILEELRSQASEAGPSRRPLTCPKCKTTGAVKLSPLVRVHKRNPDTGKVSTATLPRYWECSFCHLTWGAGQG
jgi:hypothetical protein